MSNAPSMPLFLDAYLADTTHLSTEEHGAYLLLLMAMWRRNGAVPDDDKDLARIVGLSRGKWRSIKARLLPFLTVENGEISQKRLRKEWEYVQQKREKNAENGAKGGRPRTNKNNNIAKANGSVSDNPDKSEPTPIPNPKEKEPPDGGSKKRGSRIPDDFEPDMGAALSEGLSEAEGEREFAKFRDYWRGAPGQKGVKLDWPATWRNWCRKAADDRRPRGHSPPNGKRQSAVEANLARRIRRDESGSGRRSDGDVELLPADRPELRGLPGFTGQGFSRDIGSSDH